MERTGRDSCRHPVAAFDPGCRSRDRNPPACRAGIHSHNELSNCVVRRVDGVIDEVGAPPVGSHGWKTVAKVSEVPRHPTPNRPDRIPPHGPDTGARSRGARPDLAHACTAVCSGSVHRPSPLRLTPARRSVPRGSFRRAFRTLPSGPTTRSQSWSRRTGGGTPVPSLTRACRVPSMVPHVIAFRPRGRCVVGAATACHRRDTRLGARFDRGARPWFHGASVRATRKPRSSKSTPGFHPSREAERRP